MHTSLYNDPVSHIDGYGIVNLAAGLQGRNGRYTLQFFVNSVFDKQNYASLGRDPVAYDLTGANPASICGRTFDAELLNLAGRARNDADQSAPLRAAISIQDIIVDQDDHMFDCAAWMMACRVAFVSA